MEGIWRRYAKVLEQTGACVSRRRVSCARMYAVRERGLSAEQYNAAGQCYLGTRRRCDRDSEQVEKLVLTSRIKGYSPGIDLPGLSFFHNSKEGDV